MVGHTEGVAVPWYIVVLIKSIENKPTVMFVIYFTYSQSDDQEEEKRNAFIHFTLLHLKLEQRQKDAEKLLSKLSV